MTERETIIRITTTTRDKLRKLKIIQRETYDDVVKRLIEAFGLSKR